MLVPKLRFKEFNDEWNNTYIRNIFEERSQKHYQYLELLSVTIDNGVIKRCEISGKNTSSDDKSNYKLVEINDIVYNSMRMWQGTSGVSKYKGIVSPAYTILKPKININSNFFGYMFKLPNMIYHFRVNSQGLTSDTWNLKYTQIKDIPINLPSLEEQTKIANFLSLIDRKIELQEKLVENLKLYKKGLLKKVFSNNLGWKSAKLGNIFQYEQPNNYIVENAEYNSNYTIPVLTANKGFILGYTNETNTYNKGKCIIFDDFTMDFKYVDFPFKVKSSAIKILTTKKEYNINFMYQLLKTITLEPISHQRHYISMVQNIEVTIPSIEEQNRIANLFTSLDKKIELETKKLQDLKTYKKGLLQKMFI